jgi:hypothetical protein
MIVSAAFWLSWVGKSVAFFAADALPFHVISSARKSADARLFMSWRRRWRFIG